MDLSPNDKPNGPESTMKEGRLEQIQLVIRTILHFICVCLYYSVALYGVVMAVAMKDDLLDVKELKTLRYFSAFYLTNWNFVFQTVFLSLSVIYDALQWLGKHETRLAKKIRYFRDVIFCAAVVPYTLFISAMFWTLFLINRELVFPEVYDQVVPWWFNHCVHTNITIVVLLETLIQARRHPTNFKMELIINAIIGVAYAVVYYSIHFFANRWLYAVFGVLTWWQVILFQLMTWGSCFIFYFIQFPINRLFHKEEEVLNAPVATTDNVTEAVDSFPGLHKISFQQNGPEKIRNPDFQDPPFTTNAPSVKYRSIKSDIENSTL